MQPKQSPRHSGVDPLFVLSGIALAGAIAWSVLLYPTGPQWRYPEPIHAACAYGHLERVKWVVHRAPNLVHSEDRSRSWMYTKPLHLAAMNGHTQVVRLLLEHGADVNGLTLAPGGRGRGETALALAAANGRRETIELLLASGASLSVEGSRPILPVVARLGHTAVLEVLLSTSPKPDLEVLLVAAAQAGRKETVELLESKGANLQVRDEYGNTLLHHAVFGRNTGLVGFLLSRGLDACATNHQNRTALQLAQGVAPQEITDLLRQHSARSE